MRIIVISWNMRIAMVCCLVLKLRNDVTTLISCAENFKKVRFGKFFVLLFSLCIIAVTFLSTSVKNSMFYESNKATQSYFTLLTEFVWFTYSTWCHWIKILITSPFDLSSKFPAAITTSEIYCWLNANDTCLQKAQQRMHSGTAWKLQLQLILMFV